MGGNACSDWLLRIFTVCSNASRVSMDWRVPMCNVNENPHDLGKKEDLNLLTVIGKMYAKALKDRSLKSTDRGTGKEQ